MKLTPTEANACATSDLIEMGVDPYKYSDEERLRILNLLSTFQTTKGQMVREQLEQILRESHLFN